MNKEYFVILIEVNGVEQRHLVETDGLFDILRVIEILQEVYDKGYDMISINKEELISE